MAISLYPNMDRGAELSTKERLGLTFRERDVYFEYLKEKGLISSRRLLSGGWASVRLTSEGQDYIRESNTGKTVRKILPPFMEKFGWPVLVGVAVMAIAILLGIKS